MTKIMFPRFLDKTRLIGILEIDEFFLAFSLMVAILGLSLTMPQLGSLTVMITAIVIGISSAVGYKKFKKNRPTGYTWHKSYRLGMYHPLDFKINKIVNTSDENLLVVPFGFIKEFKE